MAVGKTTHAWNQLHECLGRLFVLVINGEERSVTAAVWYSLTSDRSQRLMLAAATRASSPSRWPAAPNAKAEVLWLLGKADKIAQVRNDAVHLPASLIVGSKEDGGAWMGPLFWNGHPGALKSRGLNLLADFEWCVDYAELLVVFVKAIETAMGSSGCYGSPERPALPERPRQKSKRS